MVEIKEESKICDAECPICLEVMAEPTKLSCNHRFCIGCLGKNFIETSSCPLCRKKVSKILKVDKDFQNLVKKELPKTFEKGLKELNTKGKLFADQIKIGFEIGNRV